MELSSSIANKWNLNNIKNAKISIQRKSEYLRDQQSHKTGIIKLSTNVDPSVDGLVPKNVTDNSKTTVIDDLLVNIRKSHNVALNTNLNQQIHDNKKDTPMKRKNLSKYISKYNKIKDLLVKYPDRKERQKIVNEFIDI